MLKMRLPRKRRIRAEQRRPRQLEVVLQQPQHLVDPQQRPRQLGVVLQHCDPNVMNNNGQITSLSYWLE
jgi:hypothetical protein